VIKGLEVNKLRRMVNIKQGKILEDFLLDIFDQAFVRPGAFEPGS
jgi:hypothetical protein